MKCNISRGKTWGSHTLLCLLDTFSLAYGFRGALVVTGNITVDMDFMRAGVEVSFETEASLDFITTVQFSEYPFLVCMQMDKTTFPVRYCETFPVKKRFQYSLRFYCWKNLTVYSWCSAFSEYLTKYESSSSGKSVVSRKSKKQLVPGSEFPLHQENSNMCKKVFDSSW